jgi:hypothetical protein
MIYATKCKALIRSILRDARKGDDVVILVICEGEALNKCQLERDLIDCVFSVDDCEIAFLDRHTSRTLGTLSIVLDYDSEPCEIIQDYSANDYTQNLVYKAESKL